MVTITNLTGRISLAEGYGITDIRKDSITHIEKLPHRDYISIYFKGGTPKFFRIEYSEVESPITDSVDELYETLQGYLTTDPA